MNTTNFAKSIIAMIAIFSLLLFTGCGASDESKAEEALLKNHKALKAGNIEEAFKYAAKERVDTRPGEGLGLEGSGDMARGLRDLREVQDKVTKEQMDRVKDILSKLTPTDIKVTKSEKDGDKIKLTLTAKKDGKAIGGSATMIEEDGEWKVDKVEWGIGILP